MDEKKMRGQQRRLIAVFAAICILILFCTHYIFISMDEMYHTAIDDQLQEKAEQYRILYIKKVETDIETLQALSSFVEFSGTEDMDKMADGLYQFNARTSFQRMGYFTQDGEGVRVSLGEQTKEHIELDDICQEARDIIKQALQGQSGVSQMFYEPALKQGMLAYAVPLRQGTTVVGALFAAQPVTVFREILFQIQSVDAQDGSVSVVRGNGEVLTSTLPQHGEGLSTLEELNIFPDDVCHEIEAALGAGEMRSFGFVKDGEDYRVCTLPMGLYQIQVVVVERENSINGSLTHNTRLTQIVGISVPLLSLIYVVIATEQIRRHSKRLLHLAYRDSLTGAYNKEKFIQMVNEVWGEDGVYSVVGLNIRHFKFINELFGVEQSNLLLKYTKDVIKERLNVKECVCRDTADSFFILLKEENQGRVRFRVEEMIAAINQKAQELHPNYSVMVYCGVASTRDCIHSNDRDTELMTHVMFALNRAKQDQQSSVRFYDTELHKKEQLQNYIESHMHQALTLEEFRLYLQPKFNLKTKKLEGAEALVRWISLEGKIIFPDQFIPLFEQNGFAIQLDLYMVEQTCRQLRQWADKGLEMIQISVNQTKLLFYEEGYAERLLQITSQYQIPPSYITLEILEGLALENVAQLNACIDTLRSAGFRISMDDFGSGYSSLNTLGKLTIDELKLDRSFLLAVSEDTEGKQRSIMKSIIAMARQLNISTVAEGVETEENERMMEELLCDYGQGYYYSRPIPAHEFEARYFQHSTVAGMEMR